MASASSTTKFAFRIRTRTGMVVDHLAIHGRDEADAQRKLRQMYLYCEVLECRPVHPPARADREPASFEDVIRLVSNADR